MTIPELEQSPEPQEALRAIADWILAEMARTAGWTPSASAVREDRSLSSAAKDRAIEVLLRRFRKQRAPSGDPLQHLTEESLAVIRESQAEVASTLEETIELKPINRFGKFQKRIASSPLMEERAERRPLRALDGLGRSPSTPSTDSLKAVQSSLRKELPIIDVDNIRLRDSFSQSREVTIVPALAGDDDAGEIPTLQDGRMPLFDLGRSAKTSIVSEVCERPVPTISGEDAKQIETHPTDILTATDEAAVIIAGVEGVHRGRGRRSNISNEKLREIAASLRIPVSGTKQQVLERIKEQIARVTAGEIQERSSG